MCFPYPTLKFILVIRIKISQFIKLVFSVEVLSCCFVKDLLSFTEIKLNEQQLKKKEIQENESLKIR